MQKHCKSCSCFRNKYKEYACEYCGKLCKKKSTRALCSLECRLLGNIKKDEKECWLWQGKKTSHGYGEIMLESKRYGVHRVSYQTFKNEIPDNKILMHTCDVRNCINPDHLMIGTDLENSRDMIIKGRHQTYDQEEALQHKMQLKNKLRRLKKDINGLSK